MRAVVPMMYGFGDEREPFEESVELVEDILVDFVQDLVGRAARGAVAPGKLAMEDILYLMRKDERKFGRCRELLEMNAELKKQMKAFQSAEVEGDKGKGKAGGKGAA